MRKLLMQATVLDNMRLTPTVNTLRILAPEIAAQALPGQFVHIKVAAGIQPLLRRPFSIADIHAEQGTLTVIYRIVGEGTALMSSFSPGDTIDVMGPLGQGFRLMGERPLLVGGGMGIAPLLLLAKALCPRPVYVLMGGRTQEEMFWPPLFQNVCESIHIATDDGSLGRCGTALDMLPEVLEQNKIDVVYTCGPRVMMEGVAKAAAEMGIPCQVSLEEHMACGVGACLSCTCAASDGTRRKICSDGPVFWAEEVFL
ncbi:MAG: dihydroorotate dehydrogenase electron transfer subunit [Negativicutes bacterium]|nr:dihydroorotate dehydrogenase electron transfer subunit [Negativicutes bacterium]